MNWISVKDKLPNSISNVLVYATHTDDEECRVEVGFYDKRIGSWAGCPTYILNNVTHWMPLPEPPKN